MAFVIKTLKGIRNHWKKSTFFALAATYGTNKLIERNEINQLMKRYCEEALKFGEQTIASHSNPRSVTVILNPNANKRKAKENFEKYSEPLLHLAGISVNVVQTEKEGHGKILLDEIMSAEAILIAGGDGTVSEVITGLLRRCGTDPTKNVIPIGVLPIGRTNTLATTLFPGEGKYKEVQSLVDATMAVLTQSTKPINVMKIDVNEDESEIEKKESKPVYAVGAIEWGAFRDAESKRDKYWYFGSLRDYATYIFNGFRTLDCNCEAVMNYSEPCAGCSNCSIDQSINQIVQNRWWHRLSFRNSSNNKVNHVHNPHCNHLTEKKISATNLILETNSVNENDSVPHIKVKVGPEKLGYFDFVSSGWKKEVNILETVEARQVKINPVTTKKEDFLFIDKEEFDLKSISVTLLPKAVNVYCKCDKKHSE